MYVMDMMIAIHKYWFSRADCRQCILFIVFVNKQENLKTNTDRNRFISFVLCFVAACENNVNHDEKSHLLKDTLFDCVLL